MYLTGYKYFGIVFKQVPPDGEGPSPRFRTCRLNATKIIVKQ